jgi:hypothetical protein
VRKSYGGTRLGGGLGGLQRRRAGAVVVDQHRGAGANVAGEDVPGGHGERAALGDPVGVRQAARRDDDVRRPGEHVLGGSVDVEAEGDAVAGALRHAPVDDADHLAPGWGAGGEADLAARPVGRLEDGDGMAAGRGDARRLQAGGAGADHRDAQALRRPPGDDVRHRRLAAGGGVVDAERGAAGVDAVEAIGGADAGADAVLLAGEDPGDDVRVGDVRAGHADHVELARGDGVAGGGDVGDARGVEHREAGRAADLSGEVEMRRGGRALQRDDVGERGVGVDVAADDVEEIDLAGRDQAAGDLHALGGRQSALTLLVGDQADADDEGGADAGADGVEHRVVKRRRFSSGPPCSSSRRLVAGDQNWSRRWP